MQLRQCARTDVGIARDHNEDCFGIGAGPQVAQHGHLMVVCDGMGGHAAGEVASRIGVDTILETYYHDPQPDRRAALQQALLAANRAIYAEGRGSMGTTGVAALLLNGSLIIANVGDSRAYLLRRGELRQVSRDHSFVGERVAAGLLTAEEARVSPHRNVITRALGYQPDVLVDLFRLPLLPGDTILLSSDGMHGQVDDAEIGQILATHDPEAAAGQLIQLANDRGGPDNITVVIIQVEQVDAPASPADPGQVTVEIPEEIRRQIEAEDLADAARTGELPAIDHTTAELPAHALVGSAAAPALEPAPQPPADAPVAQPLAPAAPAQPEPAPPAPPAIAGTPDLFATLEALPPASRPELAAGAGPARPTGLAGAAASTPEATTTEAARGGRGLSLPGFVLFLVVALILVGIVLWAIPGPAGDLLRSLVPAP